MKKPINHPKLGGKVVEQARVPQRKPNSAMSGDELLKKAMNTSIKKKSVVK